MACGIAVLESQGRYSLFLVHHDNLLDSLKKHLESSGEARKYGIRHLATKNGIAYKEFDDVSRQVCDLVVKANEENLPTLEVQERLRLEFPI